MPIAKAQSLNRPVVARDGSVYFIRRLHHMGTCRGIYLPRQLLEALHWDLGDALVVWIQKDTMCVKQLEVENFRERFIPMPPRGRRGDFVPPDDEA